MCVFVFDTAMPWQTSKEDKHIASFQDTGFLNLQQDGKKPGLKIQNETYNTCIHEYTVHVYGHECINTCKAGSG